MSAQIISMITAAAQAYGVPASLAVAVAQQESGFNQAARGAAGEIGVFQLMPGTAADLGVNPYDLGQNIQGGVRYLAQQLSRFGDVAKALAAYNWGPLRVAQAISTAGTEWFRVIPTKVQGYVASVLAAAGLSSARSVPAPAVPVTQAPVPGTSYVLTVIPRVPAANGSGWLVPLLAAGVAGLYLAFAD